MKQQRSELGECPNCNCTLLLHDKEKERYVKCEICGHAYNLPKQGAIKNTNLICPLREYPILIIKEKNSKEYLWTDRACVNCESYETCKTIKSIVK
ncbi:MAG: hypothetical protein BAJALOKI1v1_430006 [Promethearchaeota archaeon]|nr:MAG: hypothetical protein BAJALOKI1v1_430006 [Candidatus Lokiarchaeota archaeon]